MKNILIITVILIFTPLLHAQKDYCGLNRDEIYNINRELYPYDNTGSYNMYIGTMVYVDMENKIVKSFLMDENDICYRSMFLYFDMKMFQTLHYFMHKNKEYAEIECSTTLCKFIYTGRKDKKKSFIILQKGDNEVILSIETIK